MDRPQTSHYYVRRSSSALPRSCWKTKCQLGDRRKGVGCVEFEGASSTSELDFSVYNNHHDIYHNSFEAQKYPCTNMARQTSKSRSNSSSFSDALNELRSFPERVTSRRRKAFYNFFSHGLRVGERQEEEHNKTGSSEQRAASNWLRRAASTNFGRIRRPSSSKVSALNLDDSEVFDDGGPVPELEMPDRISPRSPTGGAAAREAAAAQNRILEAARALELNDKSRLLEPKVPNDSESGIGIEIRERLDEAMDLSESVSRIDPSLVLPEELLTHVMSYLDALSLLKAELVSRRWHRTASSDHTWKKVFLREYSHPHPSNPDSPPTDHVGGAGLGKSRPDQAWKRMWKVRKLLRSRWRKGEAAAIYLEGHKDSVYCVQFDEDKIITGSRDRTVRVWSAHTYQCLKILGIPKPNPDTRLQTPLIDLADQGTKPLSSIFPSQPAEADLPPTADPDLRHDGSILCLQFDAEVMVTGSSDFSLIVWSIPTNYTPLHRLAHHTAGVLDVCFDTHRIVSCSKDATICIWDRATGAFLRALTGHRGPVNAVQLRANLVVSASGDGVAKLWNLASGLCIKEFPSRDRGMACVEFSPDGKTILAGGNDHVIYVFDANSGELVRELKGHTGLVRSLFLDNANGRVVSGSYDNSVKAYELRTGDLVCDFGGWTTSWMLSAKADYRRIVATSQDGRAVVMDFGWGLRGVELLEG